MEDSQLSIKSRNQIKPFIVKGMTVSDVREEGTALESVYQGVKLSQFWLH